MLLEIVLIWFWIFRKAAFHAPYKAQIALQQKQQLAAVTTAGNKRNVPKVFNVELKMVRRRKIFIHIFNLWRSWVEGEAVRQEGYCFIFWGKILVHKILNRQKTVIFQMGKTGNTLPGQWFWVESRPSFVLTLL